MSLMLSEAYVPQSLFLWTKPPNSVIAKDATIGAGYPHDLDIF